MDEVMFELRGHYVPTTGHLCLTEARMAKRLAIGRYANQWGVSYTKARHLISQHPSRHGTVRRSAGIYIVNLAEIRQRGW